MKTLIFSILLLLVVGAGSLAQATTQAFFPSGNSIAVLSVNSSTAGGILHDPDGKNLFEAMNVIPQNSIAGPGKKVETPSKGFQVVCGIREGTGYACTVIVRDPQHSRITAWKQQAEFFLEGEEADALNELFVRDSNREMLYRSVDDKLVIEIAPAKFLLKYNE